MVQQESVTKLKLIGNIKRRVKSVWLAITPNDIYCIFDQIKRVKIIIGICSFYQQISLVRRIRKVTRPVGQGQKVYLHLVRVDYVEYVKIRVGRIKLIGRIGI